MMSCKAKSFLQWLVKVLTLRNVKKSSSSHSMVQSSVHLKVKCTKCIGFSFVWKSPGEVSVRFSLHVGQHVQLSNKTLKAKQEPRVRFGSTEFLGPVWFPRIRSRNVRPTVCRQAAKLFFSGRTSSSERVLAQSVCLSWCDPIGGPSFCTLPRWTYSNIGLPGERTETGVVTADNPPLSRLLRERDPAAWKDRDKLGERERKVRLEFWGGKSFWRIL